MSISYLLLFASGILLGAILCYFILKGILSKSHVPIKDYNELTKTFGDLQLQNASKFSKQEIENGYVTRDLFNNCSIQLENVTKELKEKTQVIIELTALSEQKFSKEEVSQKYVPQESYTMVFQKLKEQEEKNKEDGDKLIVVHKEKSRLEEENKNLLERLTEFKKELEDWDTQAKEQFKNLTNEIFNEKSKDFAETNNQSLTSLLNPFKDHLTEFKQKVEDTRKEDIKEITSLKAEINSLQKLNTRLSEDAEKLTSALKSDVRIQGNWGEDRLNLILEAEGLQKYIDFTTQNVYLDETDDRLRKPDFIIKLPDNKHIIVDSKVSLNAYVDYFNGSETEQKANCLKQLVTNITSHIDRLSEKNYQQLEGLNAPDFVCMFMPIEGALSLAINESPDLIQRALNKKIVLLTPTTLVATAKMIKLLWQKENRVKNVEEIFRQCGALYDKFVLFVEELQNIGNNLSSASGAYKKAMDHLTEGQRKGVTIIGRFETIKALEAKTTKSIPSTLVKQVDVLYDSNTIDIDITPDNTYQ